VYSFSGWREYRHDPGVNASADKKEYAQSASTFMSLFSTGIMAGAALAAATAEPLFTRLDLKPTLAIAGLLALLALIFWLSWARHRQVEKTVFAEVTLSSSRTWLLLLFFGIGTGAYTLVLAWLPSLYPGGLERTEQRLYAGLAYVNRSSGGLCRFSADNALS
jgi:cyanate permease